MCLVLHSWADAERVGLSGSQHEDWPPCKRSLVLEFFFFSYAVKISFFKHSSLMASLFGFQLWQTCERSHGECQEIHQQAWFILWLCIAQSIYTHNSKWIIWPFTLGCFVVLRLLCSTTGFRLKVTVGRRCWTSTGTKQRSWKGNFFISSLWYCDYCFTILY